MAVRLSDLPASVQAKLRIEGKALKPRGKYGAQSVIDPETGRRIASKRELSMLRRLRADADTLGYVVAVQPRFVIEGGHYTADAMLLIVEPNHGLADGWFRARAIVYDAKGRDTTASRKSRRQMKQRYGIDVRIE